MWPSVSVWRVCYLASFQQNVGSGRTWKLQLSPQNFFLADNIFMERRRLITWPDASQGHWRVLIDLLIVICSTQSIYSSLILFLNWILLFGAFPGQWVPPQLSYRFNLNQVPRQISQSFYWNEATKPRKRAIVSTWSDTADKGKLEPFPVCHVLSMDKHFLLLLRHLFNGAWWLNFFQYRVLPMQIRIISLFVENDIQSLRASLNAPP